MSSVLNLEEIVTELNAAPLTPAHAEAMVRRAFAEGQRCGGQNNADANTALAKALASDEGLLVYREPTTMVARLLYRTAIVHPKGVMLGGESSRSCIRQLLERASWDVRTASLLMPETPSSSGKE